MPGRNLVQGGRARKGREGLCQETALRTRPERRHRVHSRARL